MSIQLENVSYTYGVGTPFEKTALRNVTMEISSGDFVGIIGHTGSGKSTLVQLLNGLLQPTMGQVTVNGMVIYIWVFFQYFRKLRIDAAAVRAEWNSPSKVNFFGTFTVSTVLLAAVLAPYSHMIASIFWWVALVMILLFGWILLSHWLLERQYINEVTPAWLLPVLGPITIPIAGNVLQNPGFHAANSQEPFIQAPP